MRPAALRSIQRVFVATQRISHLSTQSAPAFSTLSPFASHSLSFSHQQPFSTNVQEATIEETDAEIEEVETAPVSESGENINERYWLRFKVDETSIKSMTFDELNECFVARRSKLGRMRRRTSGLETKARRKQSAHDGVVRRKEIMNERQMLEVEMHVRRMKEPINNISAADLDTTLAIWRSKKVRFRHKLVEAEKKGDCWKGKRAKRRNEARDAASEAASEPQAQQE